MDERADVFAMGAILCEILTGEPPYSGPTAVEADRQAVASDLSSAYDRLAGSGAEAELVELARRCLAARAADRPRDAGEVARAMTAHLAGVQERLRAAELAGAQAQARAEEERKRRRVQLRMAAAIALALAAGAAGVATQWSRAEAHLRLARSRLDLARAAIDRFYTGASEDVLLREPAFNELRGKLLGSALEFYKELQASLEAESDDSDRPELAAAYERVGEITTKVGSISAAIESLDRARAIRERLAGRRPGDAEAQAALAAVLERQFEPLAEVGRSPEALDRLEQARAIRRRLVDGPPPGGRRHRLDLARVELNIGRLLAQRLGRAQAARTTIERLVVDLEEMTRADPSDPSARRRLGEALDVLALIRHQDGQFARAAEYYARAAAILEPVAVGRPEDLDLRFLLGSIHANAGFAAVSRRRQADAEDAFRRARSIYEAMVREHPTVSRFQYSLGHLHLGIAGWHDRAGRTTEAIEEDRQALGILDRLAREQPEVSSFAFTRSNVLSEMGRHLFKSGRLVEARETLNRAQEVLDRLTREHPDVVQYQITREQNQIMIVCVEDESVRRGPGGAGDAGRGRAQPRSPSRSGSAVEMDRGFPDDPFAR